MVEAELDVEGEAAQVGSFDTGDADDSAAEAHGYSAVGVRAERVPRDWLAVAADLEVLAAEVVW